MSDITRITTVQDAELYAASQGVRLNQAAYNAADTARNAHTADLSNKELEPWQRRTAGIIHTGDSLLALTQSTIIGLGVFMALIFLLIVEIVRVQAGIRLFEHTVWLAGFAAFVLVFLNLSLEFMVHYIETQAGYTHQTGYRSSLRVTVQNMLYWLGVGKDWRPVEKSPAAPYRKMLAIVSWTIIFIALLGSMQDVIIQQTGVWYLAIVAIATQSDLITLITWLSGLAYTAAIVVGAQRVTGYVARRVSQINADIIGTHDTSAAGERAAAAAIVAHVNQVIAGREQKAQLKLIEASDLDPKEMMRLHPLATNGNYANGNGNH